MVLYCPFIAMRVYSAEEIFSVIQSCIEDIELCGLLVQVISTDNYHLNVKLFKLFSPVGKLETRVPHPCDSNRPLFLTFDFAHPHSKNDSE